MPENSDSEVRPDTCRSRDLGNTYRDFLNGGSAACENSGGEDSDKSELDHNFFLKLGLTYLM